MKKEDNFLQELSDVNVMTVKEQADRLLEQFDKVPNAALQSVTSEYLTFDKNTMYNFVFMGFTDFTSDKGETVQAARLIGREGKEWINGNKVLTSALEKTTNIPCLVRIITKDEVKGKNGTYLSMDVAIIPQKTIK